MNQDWRDLFQALRDADARFLIVGAHALAVHGIPRGTQDLDLWIDASPENARRVWAALLPFGAPLQSLGITLEDLQKTQDGDSARVASKRATGRRKDLGDLEALGELPPDHAG